MDAQTGSDSFTVELSAAARGTFAGTISLETNDLEDGLYEFTVTGEIVAGAPIPT